MRSSSECTSFFRDAERSLAPMSCGTLRRGSSGRPLTICGCPSVPQSPPGRSDARSLPLRCLLALSTALSINISCWSTLHYADCFNCFNFINIIVLSHYYYYSGLNADFALWGQAPMHGILLCPRCPADAWAWILFSEPMTSRIRALQLGDLYWMTLLIVPRPLAADVLPLINFLFGFFCYCFLIIIYIENKFTKIC